MYCLISSSRRFSLCLDPFFCRFRRCFFVYSCADIFSWKSITSKYLVCQSCLIYFRSIVFVFFMKGIIEAPLRFLIYYLLLLLVYPRVADSSISVSSPWTIASCKCCDHKARTFINISRFFWPFFFQEMQLWNSEIQIHNKSRNHWWKKVFGFQDLLLLFGSSKSTC